MKVGVTGSTGFLGRRFVEMAAARGHRLVCLNRPNGRAPVASDSVEIMLGDITDAASLREFVRSVDVVVHMAAWVGNGSPADYHKVNVCGTRNICQTIADHRPDCLLIYCSSVAVLRRYRLWPWFNTLYTRSKARAEEHVRRYQAERCLRASYVYPGLMYGPRDERFVPTLLKYLKRGQLFNVSGGERWAPLVYVDDVCDLILYVVSERQAVGRRYIGVGKQEVGIHDFFRILARRIDVEEPQRKLPKYLLLPVAAFLEWSYRFLGRKQLPALSRRVVDLLSIDFDPNLVRRFNREEWSARTSLHEGLNRTFEWLRLAGGP